MTVTSLLIALCCLPSWGHGAVPISELFPFGLSNGDTKLPPSDDDSTSVTPSRLPGGFTFFNTSFPNLIIHTNGVISFLSGRLQANPVCNPLTSPIIAPFWSDFDTRFEGNVYYRETHDGPTLRKAQGELTTAFPSLQVHDISWAFVATWHEVPFYGSNPDCPDRRNTFQVVLATDGYFTFALMYYSKISTCSGYAGRAGFDYGDGKTLYTIPTSCTHGITSITETSNVHSGGKWIFRLDDKVRPGGLVTNLTTALFSFLQDLLKTVGTITQKVI